MDGHGGLQQKTVQTMSGGDEAESFKTTTLRSESSDKVPAPRFKLPCKNIKLIPKTELASVAGSQINPSLRHQILYVMMLRDHSLHKYRFVGSS